MGIHKEGHTFLLGAMVLLSIVSFAVYSLTSGSQPASMVVLILCLGLFLFFLQFFRNPTIEIDQDAGVILAPADGKVVVIEDNQEKEYFKSSRKQVSIFMSPLNVHINRNPVSGKIKYFAYHPGQYLVAWHPKSSELNERTTLVYELANGAEILVRQIAGKVARRIKWYVDTDSKVEQGDEFGFIKFGSRVDLFLPSNTEINVEIGQKTKGGKTVLATFT